MSKDTRLIRKGMVTDMSIKNLKVYRTAMYVRLSSGDEDRDGIGKSDSNSIKNQKLLIQGYINERPEFQLTNTFVDDGFSGSNFDRPGYQSMLKAVNNGEVDCIIVKDLSRIAREHVGGDELILRILEQRGVRFIAITDNFDNLTASHSDKHFMLPVKNLLNDTVCADTSIKVRTVQQTKRLNGEFIGAFAPYGYKKSKENKNHLEIDDYASKTVQEIFAKKLAGMSANAIANVLNKNGVLSPVMYKKKCGEKYNTHFRGTADSKWSAQTVGRILRDEVYIGVLAQGKRTRINHKVKKAINIPKHEWIRVQDAHEKIVSIADFQTVQLLLERDTRAVDGEKEAYLFAGILYCGDCGASMVRRVSRYKNTEKIYYICSNYNRNGKGICSRHTINEILLKEIITDQLQVYIDRLCNSNEVLEHLEGLEINYENAIEYDKQIVSLTQELKKYGILKASLYPDLQEGLITKEQFVKYRENYTNREIEIQEAIERQRQLIENIYRRGIAISSDLERFKEDLCLENLDRIALVTFIDRVLIYDDTIEIVFKYANEMAILEAIRQYVPEFFDGTDWFGSGEVVDGQYYVLDLAEAAS